MQLGVRLSQRLTRTVRVNAWVGRRGVTPSVTVRVPGGGPAVTVNTRGRITVSDNPLRARRGR
ncbi:hypothetical protein GXW83_19565 [Streptacidiphilus sp. PB12-B1b]|uniref:hypothetical protein n=1 Tax=Streptacidiphilus sp. PB12-B1b TaxID=2705012 RepID=UPI0015FE3233|nr:hypothetical protein [Streptacidiphilus sp. PB12-B1b]QMU77563.1 hypothetical protein GXW83_19565 [Streptacidiphilus sp. PB12-B1b]